MKIRETLNPIKFCHNRMHNLEQYQSATITLPTQKKPQPLESFQRALEDGAGRKLKVRINDNRSTMLSVRWEPDHTRVSLHRMFLHAPRNVMEALACYLKGDNKQLAPTIKAYIEECRQQMDYSHVVDRRDLCHQGEVYHLRELYNEINSQYFNGDLNLLITWFGEPVSQNTSRIAFGLYHDTLRLIKINRILDKPDVPRYLICYVIYHEMLHYVCPPQVDAKGTYRIHNDEFKQRELAFRQFRQAKAWIRENREHLFAEVN